jgi:hypothetical protein
VELFGLKIGWNEAIASLMEAALMVLLLDFLYVGGSPFCHFGKFFVYKSFDDIICLNNRQSNDPIHVVD